MKKIGLAGILLLLFAGVLFIVFSKSNPVNTTVNTGSQPTQVPTSPATNEARAISALIDSFYKKYDLCMKNPPGEAAGRVSEYCQGSSGLSTADFTDNLEKGGVAKAGADPVVCAQNLPESITPGKIEIKGDTSLSYISEKYGATIVNVQIELIKDSGTWKIDNIVCPKP